MLIDANFAAYSVRNAPDAIRVMNVSYADVARHLKSAPQRAANLLDGREP